MCHYIDPYILDYIDKGQLDILVYQVIATATINQFHYSHQTFSLFVTLYSTKVLANNESNANLASFSQHCFVQSCQ